MKLKIGYANIYVSDIERAVRFYRDILGLKLLMRDDSFGYASFDGVTIRIGISVVKPDADNFTELVGGQTGIAFTAPAIDPIFSTRFGTRACSSPWNRPINPGVDAWPCSRIRTGTCFTWIRLPTITSPRFSRVFVAKSRRRRQS